MSGIVLFPLPNTKTVYNFWKYLKIILCCEYHYAKIKKYSLGAADFAKMNIFGISMMAGFDFILSNIISNLQRLSV